MTTIGRVLILAALCLLAPSCAASRRPLPLMVNAAWGPLPSGELPTEERYGRDRDAFLGYVRADRISEVTSARRDSRSASWLRWGGMAVVLMGVASWLSERSDPYVTDGEAEATLLSSALTGGGLYYWGRTRKAGSELRIRCMAGVQEMTARFEVKWPNGQRPESLEEWSEYRRDQDTIVESLAC